MTDFHSNPQKGRTGQSSYICGGLIYLLEVTKSLHNIFPFFMEVAT